MQNVIGLLGVKGSGKDTAAKFLVDHRGYRRIGFADALYQEAADAFQVSVPFLNKRATKETELPGLALRNCSDSSYVACIAYAIGSAGTLTAEQLEQPRSPRFILQYWGTEYRRRGYPGVYAGDDSYWLKKVSFEIEANPDVCFVVTDVRFLNEFRFVRAMGGVLARIRRPDLEAFEALERAKSGSAAHASETELLNVVVDKELLNLEGDPDSIRDAVLALDSAQELREPA